MILEAKFEEVNHAFNADFGIVAVVGGTGIVAERLDDIIDIQNELLGEENKGATITEKLTIIEDNEPRVYNAGYTAGQDSGGGGGYDEGYADGQQAEYDRFWDSFQENGNRTEYSRAFSEGGWNDDNFRPKYDITPASNGMGYMFYRNTGITDLKGIMDACGVKFDFSKASNATSMFSQMTKNTRLPRIDWRTITNTYQAIYGCAALTEIEEIVSSMKTTYSQTFISLPALTTILFSGTIASSIEFTQSPLLSNNSLHSIADHMADMTAVWTKGSEYVPQSDYFQTDSYLFSSTDYYGPCFTKNNEHRPKLWNCGIYQQFAKYFYSSPFL